MQHSHPLPSSSGSPLPERFLSRLAGFTDLFTRPTWSNVLVLLAGAILAPGRRTVTTALRILGRECDPDIAAVRPEIWHHQISFMSRPSRDSIEIPNHIWNRMENALAHAGGVVV